MTRTRSHNRCLAWLLAALLFSPAWGALLARLGPKSSACAVTARACCCVKSGLAQCACDGHAGAAAQFAALSACSDANDLPALLLTPPPAVPAPAGTAPAALQVAGAVSPLSPALPPLAAPRPRTPPPQAA